MSNNNVHSNVKSITKQLAIENKVLNVLNNKVALKLRLDEVQLFKDTPLCQLLLSLNDTSSEEAKLPDNEYSLNYYTQVLINKIKDAVKHGKALRFTHLETALIPLTSIGDILDIKDYSSISTVSDYIVSIARKLDNAININQGFRLSRLEVELLINTPEVLEYVKSVEEEQVDLSNEDNTKSLDNHKTIEQEEPTAKTYDNEKEHSNSALQAKAEEVVQPEVKNLPASTVKKDSNTKAKEDIVNTTEQPKESLKADVEKKDTQESEPTIGGLVGSIANSEIEVKKGLSFEELLQEVKTKTPKAKPVKDMSGWCVAQESDCEVCEWEFLIDRNKVERGHWTKNNPKIVKRYTDEDKARKVALRYASGQSKVMTYKDAVRTLKEQISDLRFERAFKASL